MSYFRKVDELVALHVMQLEHVREALPDGARYLFKDGDYYADPPKYSEQMSHAWPVASKLAARRPDDLGRGFDGYESFAMELTPEGTWKVGHKGYYNYEGTDFVTPGEANTLALAICLAALKAFGAPAVHL